MEISIVDGGFDHVQDLVLYGHVQIHAESGKPSAFVADIYEGTTKDIPEYAFPLFCCRGEGVQEWSIAFTCVDLLLGRGNKKGVRQKMETWLFEVEDLETRFAPITVEAHSICCQIRYEGELSDFGIPELRFPTATEPYQFQADPSSMVLKRVQKKEKR